MSSKIREMRKLVSRKNSKIEQLLVFIFMYLVNLVCRIKQFCYFPILNG
jgi:hypothetical protein